MSTTRLQAQVASNAKLDALIVRIAALEALLADTNAQLAAVVALLGGGLPTVLTTDRLKVSGL